MSNAPQKATRQGQKCPGLREAQDQCGRDPRGEIQGGFLQEVTLALAGLVELRSILGAESRDGG